MNNTGKLRYVYFRCKRCYKAGFAYTKYKIIDCGGHDCIRKCHVEWDRISREEYEREWGRVEPDDEGEVS